MPTSRIRPFVLLFSLLCIFARTTVSAQQAPGTIPGLPKSTATTTPGLGAYAYKLIPVPSALTLTPGVVQLLDLEGRFAEEVAAGGGKAFGTWFAEDAVTLNNGKPAVVGRGAIAAAADWDPKRYMLTWVAQGAQMGPSNDMGFTWGHYEGRSIGSDGKAVITTGRYITVWKKLSDGTWKVAMDASAAEPATTPECCSVPRP